MYVSAFNEMFLITYNNENGETTIESEIKHEKDTVKHLYTGYAAVFSPKFLIRSPKKKLLGWWSKIIVARLRSVMSYIKKYL